MHFWEVFVLVSYFSLNENRLVEIEIFVGWISITLTDSLNLLLCKIKFCVHWYIPLNFIFLYSLNYNLHCLLYIIGSELLISLFLFLTISLTWCDVGLINLMLTSGILFWMVDVTELMYSILCLLSSNLLFSQQ